MACHGFNKTSKLLGRIAASPAAVLMDFEVFSIHHNNPAVINPKATLKTGGIKDTVVVSVFYNGGGRIKFQCRPDQTTNKSHIPEGADCLEVLCKLVASTDPARNGPDDSQAQWNKISSSAIVVLDFTPVNVGQKAYLFFRWVDSKRAQRNGA